MTDDKCEKCANYIDKDYVFVEYDNGKKTERYLGKIKDCEFNTDDGHYCNFQPRMESEVRNDRHKHYK